MIGSLGYIVGPTAGSFLFEVNFYVVKLNFRLGRDFNFLKFWKNHIRLCRRSILIWNGAMIYNVAYICQQQYKAYNIYADAFSCSFVFRISVVVIAVIYM